MVARPGAPAYGSATIAELLPSAVDALAGPVPGAVGNPLSLPPAGTICLLLVDGLGLQQLDEHPAQAPFLSSLRQPLVAGDRGLAAPVPSTTVASLTSLGTGLPPGRHGLVGYTSRIPGTDRLLNALHWDPEVNPEEYQPYPTVLERAQGRGIGVSVVGKREFRRSGLTRAGLRGGRYRPATSMGERIAVATEAAQEAGPSLVYVYDSELDGTGHARGVDSDAWRHQLRMADHFAEELAESLPADVVLVITGDHGMVDVADGDRLDVDDVAGLLDGVELVAGEARFRHLYCEDGRALAVAERWASELGEDAIVLPRADAVAVGWFGPVDARVLPRIGDVVVACVGELAIEHRRLFPKESRMRGMHGSVSAAEQRVPMLLHVGDWAG